MTVRLAFTALGTAVSWFIVEQPLTIARPRRVALAGGFGVGLATVALIALPVGPAFAYSNMRTDRVPPVVLSAAHGVPQTSCTRRRRDHSATTPSAPLALPRAAPR